MRRSNSIAKIRCPFCNHLQDVEKKTKTEVRRVNCVFCRRQFLFYTKETLFGSRYSTKII